MIATDTNILVYAHRVESPFHHTSKSLMESLATQNQTWLLPWPCVHEFINVVTNRRLFANPTPLTQAFDQLSAWINIGMGRTMNEGQNHLDILRNISVAGQVTGGMIHDARIAAICLQHGVTELWTADRDFSRFPKLKTRNPLVG